MKRGELWTLADDGYASKARPAVIIQGELGDVFNSIILCLLTSFANDEVDTRVLIEPSDSNGLNKSSYVMTDKIVTMARTELGNKIGVLTKSQMDQVSYQLARLLEIGQ